MNHNDFKKEIERKLKADRSFTTWLKTAKERGSRPRITRNILQPQSQEALDNMYGYYDEPKGKETTNCVVNDCTHDWGGDIHE